MSGPLEGCIEKAGGATTLSGVRSDIHPPGRSRTNYTPRELVNEVTSRVHLKGSA